MPTDPRYAVYLIPDVEAEGALSQVREQVAAAFMARAATRLPVHLTVKGFFTSTVSAEALTEAFNNVQDRRLSRLRIGNVVAYEEESVAIQVGRDVDGRVAQPLIVWDRAVLDMFLPLVSSDCEFTNSEWYGDRWDPHFTIASHDIAASDVAPVLDFVRNANQLRAVGFERAALVQAVCSDWRKWWLDVTVTAIAERSLVPTRARHAD